MAANPPLVWQPSLLEGGDVSYDGDFRTLRRHDLGAGAWVDHAPAWVSGSDTLFEQLLQTEPWESRVVHMYERRVREPRLTARWDLRDDDPPPILVEMGTALSDRFDVEFTSVGCNLYRDGSDSVAWHGDRVARELPEATIAIVSVGARDPSSCVRRVGAAASRTDRVVATSS